MSHVDKLNIHKLLPNTDLPQTAPQPNHIRCVRDRDWKFGMYFEMAEYASRPADLPNIFGPHPA